MVRVRLFILVPMLVLTACASDPQGRESVTKNIWDCMPQNTVADIWSCAQKQTPGTQPAASTSASAQKPS
jgi:hypothetical protein